MTVTSLIDRLPNWLRWLLLIPGTLLAYFVVNAGVVLAGSFADFISGHSFGAKITSHLLAPGFAGYYAIQFIYLLEPHPQHPAAVIGAGFMMLLFGVTGFFAFKDPGWATILPVITSVVGTWMAFSDRAPRLSHKDPLEQPPPES